MRTRKTISFISSFFPLKLLERWSKQNHIFPFYHLVSDREPAHIKHLYPIVTSREFNKDLDFLLKNYKPLSASALVEQLKEQQFPADTGFFLSFDDGLREFYEVIAPILYRKGVPATCFVNSDFVDNKALFYRMKAALLLERSNKKPLSPGELVEIQKVCEASDFRFIDAYDFLKITSRNQHILDQSATVLEVDFDNFLKTEQPYLTSEQIRELISMGFTIGAHSASHPNYEELNEENQLAETLGSVQYLIDNFDIKERLFSFPFTDNSVNKSFFEQIAGQVDLTFGTANIKLDSVASNLQRVPMERHNRKSAQHIIKTELLAYIIKKMMSRHIIIRD